MKTVFEVKTIEADWAPPFKKNIYTDEYNTSVNEQFDRIIGNGNNEYVFTVLEATPDKAKLKFSPLFTIKNPGDDDGNEKILTIYKGQEKTIAYLWGEKGITKRIFYKGSPSGFEEKALAGATSEAGETQEKNDAKIIRPQEVASNEEKQEEDENSFETQEEQPETQEETRTREEPGKKEHEIPSIQHFF